MYRSLCLAVSLWMVATMTSAGTNSWTQTAPAPAQGPLPTHTALIFVSDPSSASVLYRNQRGANPYTGVLKKSTDRGATWTDTGSFAQGEIDKIAIAPSNSAVVWVTLFNSSGQTFVYRSTDGGATWNPRGTGLLGTVLGFTADSFDADVAYAATPDGIFKTIDGGGTWLNVRPGDGTVPFIYELVADPTTSARVYGHSQVFGASQGVLVRTFDGGATWDVVTMPTSRVLAIDPGSPSTLYIGWGSFTFPSTGLLYRSTDYGATWNPMTMRGVRTDFNIDFLAVIPGTGGTLLLHKQCGGLYQSFDQGATFQLANQGLPGPGGDGCGSDTVSAGQIAISPATPRKVLAYSYSTAAGDGLFEFESDTSILAPSCYLSASPTVVPDGGSSTLSVHCSPTATSYLWSSNTGFASNAAGGSVTPGVTTTYTVQGVNANGTSSAASVTVVAPGPRLANISTRARVQTGTGVTIGGFIIGASTPKTVMIRATGPSLAASGVADPLLDPMLSLYRGGQKIATNNDWGQADNAGAIQASGLAPNHPKESAILRTLDNGAAYTAVVEGAGGTTGVGNVEVFEVDHPESPLINISTRANVLTGEGVVIAGFIIQGLASKTVVINVAGPSLTAYFPASELLADPKLTLVRSSDQSVIATNDDWLLSPDAAAIQQSGFAPNNQKEPAIIATLPPGAYTAIVEGVYGGTGKAVVGVFAVP